jgi:two-component system NtrC family sensor kinase
MVSGAAHEINNPLTAIMGYAELMLEDPKATKEQRDMAEKIRAQSRRTKGIVAQLQSFSSQERAEKRHLCDINSIASNAMRIEDMNFGLHGIEFHEQFDPTIPRVMGDEYQLLEVCMHIINNSVDALKDRPKGSITLRTRSEHDFVVMEFSDNGPGLEDPARVFDPFYTTKPLGEGAGLGLSASYGIIKEHGGLIQVFNRPEGGATVLVKLPAARENAAELSAFSARSGISS